MLGTPLGPNFGQCSCDFSLEFLYGHILKSFSKLFENLESLGAFAIELVQSAQILGRNNARDWDPAFLHHDAGLTPVDLIDQAVELLLDLGDLHRLRRRLLRHIASLQIGFNGIEKDRSALFGKSFQIRLGCGQ
jgi:hypothetical protein